MLEANPILPSLVVRDWARRLFAYEDVAGTASRRAAPATLRVYEKLRKQLSAPVGVEGFQTLASRALILAKSQSRMLSSLQIMPDGSLHGLEVDSDLGLEHDGEAGVALIAQLLCLILTFLGEATTRRLIEDVRLQAENTPKPNIVSELTETGSNGSAAAGLGRADGFEDILREVDRLRSTSEALEAMAQLHPDMENGLVIVAGNIRSIATVLDVFVLVRRKSDGRTEDSQNGPFTGYVM